MLFKQVAEVRDGSLVGRSGAAQIDSGKAAQYRRFIERILGSRVGQVEPVLQKVDAQHDAQAHWLPPLARLRIMRFDQGFQLGPGNHCIHGGKKLLPAAGAGILFKLGWQAKVIWRIAFSLYLQFESTIARITDLLRGSLNRLPFYELQCRQKNRRAAHHG